MAKRESGAEAPGCDIILVGGDRLCRGAHCGLPRWPGGNAARSAMAGRSAARCDALTFQIVD